MGLDPITKFERQAVANATRIDMLLARALSIAAGDLASPAPFYIAQAYRLRRTPNLQTCFEEIFTIKTNTSGQEIVPPGRKPRNDSL